MEDGRRSRIPRFVQLRPDPAPTSYASMHLQQKKYQTGAERTPAASASNLKSPRAKKQPPVRSFSGGDCASTSSAQVGVEESPPMPHGMDLELTYRGCEENLDSTPAEVMIEEVKNPGEQLLFSEYIRITPTASDNESSAEDTEDEESNTTNTAMTFLSEGPMSCRTTGLHVPATVRLCTQDDGEICGKMRLWNKSDMTYGFKIMMNDAARSEYTASPSFGYIHPFDMQMIEITAKTTGFTNLMAANDVFIVYGIGIPTKGKLTEDTLARYLKLMYQKYPHIGEKLTCSPVIAPILGPRNPEDFFCREMLMKMFNSVQGTRCAIFEMNEAINTKKTWQKTLFFFIVVGVIFASLSLSLYTMGAEDMAPKVDPIKEKDEAPAWFHWCRMWSKTC